MPQQQTTESEVVNAKQLHLDFSSDQSAREEVSKHSPSNVLSLNRIRQAKIEKSVQAAYSEIVDSVKHIKLRSNFALEDGSPSLYG